MSEHSPSPTNPPRNSSEWWRISEDGSRTVFTPIGEWTMHTLSRVVHALRSAQLLKRPATLDGSALTNLDTAGAMIAIETAGITPPDGAANFINIAPRHQKIFELVLDRFRPVRYPEPAPKLPLVQEVGRGAIEAGHRVSGLVSFFGETALSLGRILRTPRLLRTRELFVQLERVCVFAIPIVALVTFLIGVVVAYLSATQLQKYGANIFLVDGVGLTMARELSPVLVAIIVAGRSGSAFTAQIGAMKINEEIDALRALGLSPMHVLVVPRLLALIIALPLLTFVGDIVGIAGGAVIANNYLGITPTTFLERLQTVLAPRHFLIGIGKAPVFAFFIALIGCRMGLNVENTATSVGLNTTSTVVQSIVSVILLDAAFAVIFQEMGL